MISVEYLNWLYNLYGNPEYKFELFKTLSEINYIWQFQLDSNRASAGLLLRERFAYEAGVYQSDVADGPCSVLEMICALADDMSRECGQYDDKYFVIVLLKNLGLDPFQTYSIDTVKTAVDIWLNRQYMPNGCGNIFYVPNRHDVDMRKLDTWTQMNLYLNEYYPFDKNFLKD